MDASVPNRDTISWDSNANGQIQDGGSDMYDGGNMITTSRCGTQLQLWTDNFAEAASDCFGPGGTYRMDIRSSMMILLAANTPVKHLSITITGNLGADGGGNFQHRDFTEGTLSGFSVCGATDPSINHLFVVDSTTSPSASHSMNGIGPGGGER